MSALGRRKKLRDWRGRYGFPNATIWVIIQVGLLVITGIVLLKVPRPVYADGPAPALVVVHGDYVDLQAVRRQVEQAGGRVEHIFPPDTFIARLTLTQAEQVRLLPQVSSLTFDPAPALSGAQAQAPLAIWNQVFHGPAIQLQAAEPFSDEVLIAPDLPPPGVDIPPDKGGLIPLALPFGASYYDTSTYMLGDVVVALVLPESNGQVDGNFHDWTAAEVADVQSTTVAGMAQWAQAEPNANLTFIYHWASAPPPAASVIPSSAITIPQGSKPHSTTLTPT